VKDNWMTRSNGDFFPRSAVVNCLIAAGILFDSKDSCQTLRPLRSVLSVRSLLGFSQTNILCSSKVDLCWLLWSRWSSPWTNSRRIGKAPIPALYQVSLKR
jgi:hypothetical protein